MFIVTPFPVIFHHSECAFTIPYVEIQTRFLCTYRIVCPLHFASHLCITYKGRIMIKRNKSAEDLQCRISTNIGRSNSCLSYVLNLVTYISTVNIRKLSCSHHASFSNVIKLTQLYDTQAEKKRILKVLVAVLWQQKLAIRDVISSCT